MFDLPLRRALIANSLSAGRKRAGFAALAAAMIIGPAGAASNFAEQPLAPRSGPRGETMFALLPAEATGVKAPNSYADPAMWAERYQEANVGAVGTGVAIGDYDGDGRADIFVVSKIESGRLFRNLGGFRFEDVTTQAGVLDSSGQWKQGASFADVNNDGRLDLYVCRSAAANLLYINQGDGTFKEEADARGLAHVGGSCMAAFADYDRDGWLDVYLLTNLLDAGQRPEGEPDRLFRNNRDGTFSDVSERAGILGDARGHSATWWDYDHDGWLDLYVANDFAPRDVLYRNNRDGTFSDRIDAAVPHHPFSSMGADLGDVNNDGLIDLFVADMAATTLEKDRRGMADSRARTRDPAARETPQYQRNALFLGTATDVCHEAAFLAGIAATDWTWSPRFEDLDNDGKLDLHVTTGMNREQHNADLLNRMMAAATPVERIRLMRGSPVFAERNLAYRNVGDLEFENVGTAWGLQQIGVSFGSAFGDLDGDGDLDLVCVNYQAEPTVLRNDSDAGHRLIVQLVGTRSNRFGVGAVVEVETAAGRQVRQLALARGYASSSEPTLHFGLGEQSRVDRLTVRWPSGQVQTFSDVAADRRLTLTEPDVDAKSLSAEPLPKPAFSEVASSLGLSVRSEEEERDQTLMQPLLPFRLHRRGPALAVGDLTGDGIDEIVFGGTTKNPLRIARREANGGYRLQDLSSGGNATNDGPVLIFDANGDGANDLLVTRGGANWPEGSAMYEPRLFLNDGRGDISAAPEAALPSLPISAGAAVAADFNRDGLLDVFVGGRVAPGQYPQTPRSALLINRGGRFEVATESAAPGLAAAGLVTAALWTDVDDDGWSDLLVAVEWGTIRCWRNLGNGTLEEWSGPGGFAAAGHGWWTSLGAGDFNGDGRIDYIAGNVGLNTPYGAPTADRPACLFYGDFRGNGEPQLVEAVSDHGTLYPSLSRRQLGAAVPALLKKFPSNDAFARLPLEQVFSKQMLAQAERFTATELRSGVFLSQPLGPHRFVVLPRIAQIAPTQGIAIADFDDDGTLDVFLAQNFYGPAPSIGRFDGGLGQLLKGDGRGGFHPVPLAESGLLVKGDARAAVLCDVDADGRAELAITRNNDDALVFRRDRPPAERTSSIVLKGTPGNRAAIGAKVTVTLTSGAKKVMEVSAGSSALSQSPATLFISSASSDEPREVSVRWPDGRTSVHAVVNSPAKIVISEPEL